MMTANWEFASNKFHRSATGPRTFYFCIPFI
jgi:hypothetical protein